jgi:hypothetical protein
MSNKAIHYNIAPVQLSAPAARTTTVTSAAFDREAQDTLAAPYEALEILLETGAYTDGTFTPKLQDSPDNSTYTDVAAANILGAFTAVSSSAGQNKIQRVAYVGTQRYVKCIVTVTGSPSTGMVMGITGIGGYPRNLPTVASGS